MDLTRREAMKLAAYAASLGALANTAPIMAAENSSGETKKPVYRMRKLYHGVAWYPELWPRKDIARDLAEMKKIGINVVRIGEFAWSAMEPREGHISLDFFREVLDGAEQAGIDVVFCTPTATPPIWLSWQHPERAFVNQQGETMIHGARQHMSYEHPAVRKACFRIVEACAKALGQHPALVAWQLDNEIKCHVAEDFSQAAVKNWHKWLQQRFGSIDKLNQAWGTGVWSETYQKFEQVPPPRQTPFLHNASLSTAYRLFSRDSIGEFLDAQSEIIRRYSSQPITHNDNPAFSVSHERLFKNLDFASWDAYPSYAQWPALVFRSDLYRAAKPQRPFWLMETSTAHNGWLGNHQVIHPPGFLEAEAVLTYALGGEAFNYWLWRQQRSGAELPHSAVMSAWFKPGIGYREVTRVEAARRKIEALIINSAPAAAEVAVTWSDQARAMIQTEALDQRPGFPKRYREVIALWHENFRRLGYHRDVRFEGADLDGLKLLITPAMPWVSESFLARVEKFVSAGGIWIAGPATGIRGAEHTVPTDAGLGLLENFAGVETEFVFPLTEAEASGSAFGKTAPLSGWCAAVKAAHPDTRVRGELHSAQAENLGFLTERKMGQGKVVLLSAHPDGDEGQALLDALIVRYASEAGVLARHNCSAGVTICPRRDFANRDLWFVINMENGPGEAEIPAGSIDAFSGQALGSTTLHLNGFAWRALVLPG